MEMTRAEFLRNLVSGASLMYLNLHGSRALAATATQPGTALLCGIDYYPNLRGGPGRIGRTDLKKAGTNSAEMLRTALLQHGFRPENITMLVDPTKGQILEKIPAIARPGQPFLFYFLGHGSEDAARNGTLLAADAQDDAPDTFLRRDELRATLTDLMQRGVLVTALLDACESWGMAFELGEKSLTPPRIDAFPLYYEQFLTKDLQVRPAAYSPGNMTGVVHQPCFFTAADDAQKAWVAPWAEEQNHNYGVFSYYLAQAIKDAGPGTTWDTVYQKIVTGCSDFSTRYSLPAQTPKITSAYRKVALFEGKSGDRVDFEHMFDIDLPDPSTLTISIHPDTGTVNPAALKVKDGFSIEITICGQGYLIAVERTPEHQYRLHFPADFRAESALVTQTISLPSDQSEVFYHDRPGVDTFKVFLYKDIVSAEKMLSLLDPGQGNAVDISSGKDLRTRPGHQGDIIPQDLVTATYRFDVEP